jgi:RND family efflux transporter MFP subunit
MEYKGEIVELNKKIDELNKLLGNDTLVSTHGFKVGVFTVKKQHFAHYVDVTGNVDAVDNALISPQTNGQIVKIYVTEGQYVKKGQLLAKLNDEILRNNLAQLQTSLLLADTMYEKQKTLYEQNVVSEVQYLQAKSQKETLEKNIDVIKSQIALSRITAPFSGIIDQIFKKEGEIAPPGQPMMQLVNLSKMEVTAQISENYLPDLEVGDLVSVSFPTYPDIFVESKISFKGNVIDPVNRTFRIKVKFDNVQNKIKPNMLAVVRFKDFEAEDVLVVPTNTLSKDINGWFLFVLNQKQDKNVVEKKYVTIGISDKNNTLIKSGLSAGEQIITKGNNLVKDGMIVEIDNQN